MYSILLILLVFAGGYLLWWTFSILCRLYLNNKKYVQMCIRQQIYNGNMLQNTGN